ncbi:hypothetical protein M1L60_22785 [Actinoplanes sp. TRM 88003]|uniref:Fibronectin type-III domain-containing protein n=1 Tax=Paractinoplanes aksuensis TaxID=2939490 RepID=A0ABT1DRF6_9ACTN|nr:hypothetical protein [Actinoplanes aksuensis]MCO8273423.1 hypothetical protein [Actinoplanes aksuensis]
MRRVCLLTVLPFLLGACGGANPSTGASPTAAPGEAWVNVVPGQATSSPAARRGGSYPPALPPVSFLPTSSACAIPWQIDVGQVLIPLVVTPGAGSLKVEWPARYGKVYRVAAVPQEIVSGAQPEPKWQTVTTGSGCSGSATIGGLTPGAAYVVWLDAPDTPRGPDNSRSLYSGRSGIVKPK